MSSHLELTSTFFGRDRERAAIATWLETAAAAPLALLGAPGIGKSALAARAVFDAGCAFAWVDSGGAADEDVGLRLAAALGSVRSDATALARSLRGRVDVVVFDDADEARSGCVAIVQELAARGASVHVCTTSRRALALPRETRLVLDGLGAPRGDEPLEDSAAWQLLVERVRAIAPNHRLSADDPALRAILERVGDLPLAVELVAPQIVELGARALAERLERPLDWLVDGADAGSLRRALAHTYAPLGDAARHTLAQLARLGRPFDADDVEVVVGSHGIAALGELRVASWVVRHPRAPAERGRFDVLAPLAQFVMEVSGPPSPADRASLVEATLRGAVRGAHAPVHALVSALEEAAPALSALVADALEGANALLIGGLGAPRFATLALALAERHVSERARLLRVAARAELEGGRFVEAQQVIDALANVSAEARADADALRAHHLFRTGRYEALAALDLHALPRRADDVEPFATAASIRGDGALAVAIYRRALEGADERQRPTLLALLARLLVERADADADVVLAEAEALAAGDLRRTTSVAVTRTLLEHDRGDHRAAAEGYARSAAAYGAMGNVLASYLRFLRGVALLEDQRDIEARAAFLTALDDAPAEMVQLAPLIALARWAVHHEPLARAADDGTVIASSQALVHAYVERCEGRTADVAPAVRAAERHARWSVVSRVLVRVATRAPPPSQAHADAAGLLVGPEARWFAVVGEREVSLEHRPVLMRVLGRLVLASADPDGCASVDEIARAAWPGERILDRAKKSRVHVAVATLRKLGLGDHLARLSTGYRIALPVRQVAR